MNDEKEPRSAMSEQKRTALLRYMTILFAVAFLLVLLSYLIQVFNSRTTISQLNATSASALQNAERLQTTNRELTEETQRLQDEITALNEEKQAQEKAAEADREKALEEGRAAGEETGRASALAEAQKAYDLLLKAATTGDEAERAKAIAALEEMRGILSEAAQKQLDALAAPGDAAGKTESDEQNKP